ncbi:MAG: hypothetical protein HY542_07290 [Deltaproteobacteria bacterium]|nr:hypothetical protein [Deltaproteobacteria bacterium]
MLRKLAKTHWILFATLFAHWALFAHYYPEVLMDDMYINIRYADNLYRGLGLTYNIGEPFEGYSAFLFIILQAGLRHFTEDWFLIAKSLGIGFLTAFIVVFYFFARRYLDDQRALCLLMGVAAVDPAFVAAGSIGMETSMYLFVTLATVGAFIAGTKAGRFKIWPLFAVISALTRPEGIMFVAILIAAEVLSSYEGLDRAKTKSYLAKIFTPEKIFVYVLIASYFFWRCLYYGTLLTGPAVAKSSFLPYSVTNNYEFWIVKFKALVLLGIAYGIPILSALYFAVRKRRDECFKFLIIFTTLYFAFSTVFHGMIIPDTAHFWRYHGQVVPFTILLAVLGWQLAVRENLRLFGTALLVVFVVLMVVYRFPKLAAQMERLDSTRTNDPKHYEIAGKMMAELECGKARQGLKLATTEAGAPPFFSGLYTIDLLGLNNGDIARFAKDGNLEALKRYVIDLRPDFFFLFEDMFIYTIFSEFLLANYEVIYDGNGVLLFKDKNLVCEFSPQPR